MPRFFVGSARSAVREARVDRPAELDEIAATLTVGDTELIVGLDAGRALKVVSASARAELPPRAKAQLAFHEVAGRRPTTIRAREVYVFDLQMVELLRDAPGLNDPLYLYGTLRGPYPDALTRGATAIDGQLTTTRGNLLEGLIGGVATPFVHEPRTEGCHAIHAMLPGDRAEEIAAGRAVIAAFPVATTSLSGGAANDLLVAQIFHDVLAALRAELGVVAAEPRPVPSRPALEERLIREGWRIDGDDAIRGGKRGVLASLFGSEERKRLPRQATLDEYAREATALLAAMTGWPTPEALALRGLLRPSASPPIPRAAPPPPPPPPLPVVPEVRTPSTEWMKDFVDAHPRPVVRSPSRAVTPPASPSWMDDFPDDDD